MWPCLFNMRCAQTCEPWQNVRSSAHTTYICKDSSPQPLTDLTACRTCAPHRQQFIEQELAKRLGKQVGNEQLEDPETKRRRLEAELYKIPDEYKVSKGTVHRMPSFPDAPSARFCRAECSLPFVLPG